MCCIPPERVPADLSGMVDDMLVRIDLEPSMDRVAILTAIMARMSAAISEQVVRNAVLQDGRPEALAA